MAAFSNNRPAGGAPVAQTPNFIWAAANKAEHERQMLAAKRLRQERTMQGAAQGGNALYKQTGYNPLEAMQYGINKVRGNEAGNAALRDTNKAQVDKWDQIRLGENVPGGNSPAPQTPGTPPAPPTAPPPTAAPVPGAAPNLANQAAQAAALKGGGASAALPMSGATTLPPAALGGGMSAAPALAAGGQVAGPMSVAGSAPAVMGAGGAVTGGLAAPAATAGASSALAAAPAAGAAVAPAAGAAVGGGAATAGAGMLAAAGPIGWAALAALTIYGLMSS